MQCLYTFPPSPKTIAACISFSKRKDVGLYTSEARNPYTDAEKCRKDALCSKMSEFAAGAFLSEKMGYDRITPDLAVYPVRERNWDEDLSYGGTHMRDVAVKSSYVKHTSSRSGVKQYSWTFSACPFDPLLEDTSDDVAIVLTVVNYLTLQTKVVYAGPWGIMSLQLGGLLLRPQNPNITTKLVMYEDDIEAIGFSDAWKLLRVPGKYTM